MKIPVSSEITNENRNRKKSDQRADYYRSDVSASLFARVYSRHSHGRRGITSDSGPTHSAAVYFWSKFHTASSFLLASLHPTCTIMRITLYGPVEAGLPLIAGIFHADLHNLTDSLFYAGRFSCLASSGSRDPSRSLASVEFSSTWNNGNEQVGQKHVRRRTSVTAWKVFHEKLPYDL